MSNSLRSSFFPKIVNDFKLLTMFSAKSSILDVWRDSNYVSTLETSKMEFFSKNSEGP